MHPLPPSALWIRAPIPPGNHKRRRHSTLSCNTFIAVVLSVVERPAALVWHALQLLMGALHHRMVPFPFPAGHSCSALHTCMWRCRDRITDEKGCRVSVVCRPSSIMQQAENRFGGAQIRAPGVSFRHVVPNDGRICHALELELSIWDP